MGLGPTHPSGTEARPSLREPGRELSSAIVSRIPHRSFRQMWFHKDLPQRTEEHRSEFAQRLALLDWIVRPQRPERGELLHEIRNQNLQDSSRHDGSAVRRTFPNHRVKGAGRAPDVEVPVVAYVFEAVKQVRLSIGPREGKRIEHPAAV